MNCLTFPFVNIRMEKQVSVRLRRIRRTLINWNLLGEYFVNRTYSTAKTLQYIIIYFLLFLAGELLNSLIFDTIFRVVKLPIRDLYVILRMAGGLIITYILFWLYTARGLHLKMTDFGITLAVQKWGILYAVCLPVGVAAAFLFIGEGSVNAVSFGEVILIIIGSLLMAFKAGILEEMLFRGYIMRLLESRWNKCIAILVPSFVFSLVHIPSMQTFSVSGVLLLIVSGTLVGMIFSFAAYKGNSISNSVLLHAVWNFLLVTDVLHITTSQEAYGAPIFSIIIPSDNIFITGAGFGVEASLVSIIGYFLICGAMILPKKKSEKSSLSC